MSNRLKFRFFAHFLIISRPIIFKLRREVSIIELLSDIRLIKHISIGIDIANYVKEKIYKLFLL
jgi:hypothetical protein